MIFIGKLFLKILQNAKIHLEITPPHRKILPSHKWKYLELGLQTAGDVDLGHWLRHLSVLLQTQCIILGLARCLDNEITKLFDYEIQEIRTFIFQLGV